MTEVQILPVEKDTIQFITLDLIVCILASVTPLSCVIAGLLFSHTHTLEMQDKVKFLDHVAQIQPAMQATTDVICGGEKSSPAGWFCLFVCVPCLMHYRVVVVSRSHWNHSVLLCGRDFTGFLCDCMCFPEGTASPLSLSLSLRGGNSIWLLKCCGRSMSALQPLNDHPVRSD